MVTQTLTGYTSGSFPPSVSHKGTTTLTFGGKTGSNNSGWVNPSTYITVPVSVMLDNIGDQCLFTSDTTGFEVTTADATVTCSVVGAFFQEGGSFLGELL